jgi:hypothetical protein
MVQEAGNLRPSLACPPSAERQQRVPANVAIVEQRDQDVGGARVAHSAQCDHQHLATPTVPSITRSSSDVIEHTVIRQFRRGIADGPAEPEPGLLLYTPEVVDE